MKRHRFELGWSFLIVALLLGALPLFAQGVQKANVHFKDITVPGATETDTYGLNDANIIVGDYVDSAGVTHGMAIQGQTVTTYDDPNGTGTQGYGINTQGDIVGWYTTTSTEEPQGFLYKSGVFTDVGPSGELSTEATGINDAGDMVGVYTDSSGVEHGWLWNGTAYKTFDVSGVEATIGWGINNNNLITLYVINDSGLYDAYSTTDLTTFTNIDVPGATQSVAHAANNRGDIVMTWFDSSSEAHGAVLHSGNYTTFDDPNSPGDTRGDGIDTKGVVVGRYTPTGLTTNVGYAARVRR